MRARLLPALGILLCFSLTGKADAFLDSFLSNSQGWMANSFGYITAYQRPNFAIQYNVANGPSAVTWSSTFGNPAGSISIVDPDGGAEYFEAGPDFMGNASAYSGESLNFDETEINFGVNGGLTLADPADPLVALTNGTTILVYDNTFAPPSQTGWSSYTVPLAPGAGWFETSVDSGNAATAQDFQSVLSNLTGVYLLADWYVGTDTTGLDNVQFTPEPGTWMLMLSALFIVMLFRSKAICGRMIQRLASNGNSAGSIHGLIRSRSRS